MALGVVTGVALIVGVRGVLKRRNASTGQAAAPGSDPAGPKETTAAFDLHRAAQMNDVEALKRLLQDGARAALLDGRHQAGETPLHRACGAGHLEAARLLLEMGADPSPQAKEGETPMHLAALEGNGPLVRLLLEAGARVDVASDTGLTPLHLAAMRGDEAIVQALLEAGASVHAVDAGGNQPLHRAAAEGHLRVVDALLGAGADPSVRGYNGMTAESLAVLHRHPEVVARLRLVRPGNGQPIH